MYGILGGKFAIITADYDEVITIRDQLKELDLFERFSYDVGRMIYLVYLKTVDTNNYKSLYSLVHDNKYRLVKCY